MKTLLMGIFATALMSVAVLAQDTTTSPANNPVPSDQQNPPAAQATPAAPASAQPTPAQASAALRIAPGSVIPVQLTKSIDAKKAKTGDEVQATVTQDMKTQNGDVLVPKDTKVIGHITEAQSRSKEQPQSQVGIAFDRAVVKDKGDVSLPMSIQAIIMPSNPNAGTSDNAAPPEPNPGTSQSASSGTPASNGRSSGTSAGTMPPPAAPPSASEAAGAGQSGAGAREPITAKTQGVVGVSNLKLAAPTNSTQGTLLTSEKDNVKLESGTLLLLRVNP